MRFSTFFISAVIAVLSVQAQSNTTTTTSVVSGTAITPAQASAAACLKTCASDDAVCQQACVALANGVNPIANCQTLCPKGNGTEADNLAYTQCVSACISTAGVQATAFTTTTSATVATSTAASETSGSGSGSGPSGTSSGPPAASSTFKSASSSLHMCASLVGLLAVFMAMLAL